MKIQYKFINGDTSVVEISDDIGAFIVKSRNDEHADNVRRSRRGDISYDAIQYEGRDDFGCEFEYAPEMDKQPSWLEQHLAILNVLLSHLTETQLRRLRLHADGMTMREIAEAEGVQVKAVFDSIEQAKKKIKKISKKFLENH